MGYTYMCVCVWVGMHFTEDKVLFLLLTTPPSFCDKTQFCSVFSIAYW